MTGRESRWVIRREFDCDEGKVARWWLGPDAAYGERPGFGEPEDAAQFPTRLIAESEYRVCSGRLERCVRAQRVSEAFAEVSGSADPVGMTTGQRTQDAAPVAVTEVGSVVP
jgi:hypothetical protein